jgi:hypothetical protein
MLCPFCDRTIAPFASGRRRCERRNIRRTSDSNGIELYNLDFDAHTVSDEDACVTISLDHVGSMLYSCKIASEPRLAPHINIIIHVIGSRLKL